MKPKKVLILGSGALKIGEAGEFDYSGSQAIKALKEEKIYTVLVNPNIATFQTSKNLADTVYFLPVTPFFVEKVIEKEKPDAILLSFGGQTALNCGLALRKKGILKKHHVKVLGTPVAAIELTEDRKKFADHLRKIGIPTPISKTAQNFKQALKIAKQIGYPVMIRSGFALGGQGSGVAKNQKELEQICEKAFAFGPQILVEQYLHHYKEIEYEVVRDKDDNCITVCNMENMDPLGIHTGESIVVAPSQTLTNQEYHTLRAVSIKIVRSLGIVGECNVQFALNPKPKELESEAGDARGGPPSSARSDSEDIGWGKRAAGPANQATALDFYVIEVNARLSRSSALASKATGYPLAYVAAKLALEKNLTEIKNKVTGVTQSCFEPSLDYIVVKIPRWDIEKFKNANDQIGTSMKSVGEVMGIGRTFEEAYQKAIRMLDLDLEGATDEKMLTGKSSLTRSLEIPTPKRMFALSHALRENISVEKIYSLTGIDPWFLQRVKNIVDTEKNISSEQDLSPENLLRLKQLGFSDKQIGSRIKKTGLEIRELRKRYKIVPAIFQIDTLAGEFPAKTNYLYTTYNGNHSDVEPTQKKGVIVLGSGPYRIGSSVEFDWTSVATVLRLKKHNKESIIINCNPETVSTDYDISDRLYFEELTFERIADIYEFENPTGIIISVGGQTPNNRAQSLKNYGFEILGTDPVDINRAEDRTKFSKLLDTLHISQPQWDKFSNITAALTFCDSVGYPVLIRPSYVLSGTLMRVCHNKEELSSFLKHAGEISKEYPITVSKFIQGAKEIELDAVAAGGEIQTCIISEHVENAGVHSGDATIVLPPQKINAETHKKLEDIAKKLASNLHISGPFNIQFLAKDNDVSVIEINLRSSRTFPFISKVTGINLIDLCVDAFFEKAGTSSKQTLKPMNFVAVKAPQFSFARLTGSDPVTHVEMASTGEVACFGEDIEEAFLKAELSVGGKIPQTGIFLSLGGDENKNRFLDGAGELVKLGLPIFATVNTAQFLREHGIEASHVYKIHEKQGPNALEIFNAGKIDLAINIVEAGIAEDVQDYYALRRAAVDHNIQLYTNRQKALLFVKALVEKNIEKLPIKSWSEYL
ncbi:MAG TPA: carbamoyl-phosphate synthase large subunit [Candidatus Saccharimonadales bacterium]|nr:carbamoyl-phosphate synthase large subunit [Candidatus Saccharimonadales bacterium]